MAPPTPSSPTRGAIALVLVRGGGIGLQFLAVVAVAWRLEPTEAGVYFFAFSIAQIAAALARLGLDQALLRHVPAWHHAGTLATIRGAVATAMVACAAAGTGAAFALGPLVANDLRLPLAAATVGLGLQLVVLGAVQGLSRTQAFAALRDVVQPALFLVPLLTVGGDARAALGYLAASYAATGVIGLVVLVRSVGLGRFTLPGRAWALDALALWPSGLLTLAGRWLDTFVLGLVADPTLLATFTPLSRGAALAQFPLTVLNVGFPPRAALLHRLGDRPGLAAVARWTTALAAVACGALVVVVLPYVGPIARVVAPADAVADPALAFALLLLGNLAAAAVGPTGYLLLMTGRPLLEALALAAGLAAYTALVLVAVPQFGLVAAAVGVAVLHLATNGLRLGFIARGLGLGLLSRHHVVVAVVVAIVGAAALGLELPTSAIVAVQVLGLVVLARAGRRLVRSTPTPTPTPDAFAKEPAA